MEVGKLCAFQNGEYAENGSFVLCIELISLLILFVSNNVPHATKMNDDFMKVVKMKNEEEVICHIFQDN